MKVSSNRWKAELLFDCCENLDLNAFKFITKAKVIQYITENPITILDVFNICYYANRAETTNKNKARLVKNAVEFASKGFNLHCILTQIEDVNTTMRMLKRLQ